MKKKFLILFQTLFFCTYTVAQNADVKYEAESATLSKCEIITNQKYSGGKAVRSTEASASITFSIDIKAQGKYKLLVSAEGIGGEKTVNCSVNGVSTSFKCNNYGEVEIGTFILAEKDNKIVITPNWTWYNIDYVKLESAGQSISFNIAKLPITANATNEAKALYSFLEENFGKRTISGMMTGSMDKSDGLSIKAHEDILAVYNISGYYPALVGFDFMNGTGKNTDNKDSWFKQYNDRVLSLAKDTWRQGGIPDFSWHWRDPSRATGEFYTEKTKLNFTTAMNSDGSWNSSSDLYQNIVKDIDQIAEYFLELQQAGVACIFRPLHEAAGGWFWWGAQGAEPYKKLYQLLYNEMVNVKGVHNLVWDWNADNSKGELWCPGEDYFDIVSTDIYNQANDHSSNYPEFDKLVEMTKGKKIVALAENGPIPDIDKQDTENAMWSWWMPWYQSWDGCFVDKTSAEEWKKCMSDPRIITLESMPGWSNYSSIESTEITEQTYSAVYDLYGNRIASNRHNGIVIINGKKVMII